jgi:hypothetical protein
MAYPESKNGSTRCLTEPPILVVFGEGKERVSRLTGTSYRTRPESSRAAGLACGMDRGRGNSHRPSTATLGDIFGHGNGNYGVARMPERRGTGGSNDR